METTTDFRSVVFADSIAIEARSRRYQNIVGENSCTAVTVVAVVQANVASCSVIGIAQVSALLDVHDISQVWILQSVAAPCRKIVGKAAQEFVAARIRPLKVDWSARVRWVDLCGTRNSWISPIDATNRIQAKITYAAASCAAAHFGIVPVARRVAVR